MFPGGKIDEEDTGSNELERAARGGLRELCEEADVSLDLDSLTTFSHWLTPAGQSAVSQPGFSLRRFPQRRLLKLTERKWWRLPGCRPAMLSIEHRAGRLRLPPPPLSACWMFLAAIACARQFNEQVNDKRRIFIQNSRRQSRRYCHVVSR